MEFTIILATDEDRGIGKGGSLPWKSKRDLNMVNKPQTWHYGSVAQWGSEFNVEGQDSRFIASGIW